MAEKHGREPEYSRVPKGFIECVEKILAGLPTKCGIDWLTFCRYRLTLLTIPGNVRKRLDEEEVLGSAGAKEAIVRVDDELAWKMMED